MEQVALEQLTDNGTVNFVIIKSVYLFPQHKLYLLDLCLRTIAVLAH